MKNQPVTTKVKMPLTNGGYLTAQREDSSFVLSDFSNYNSITWINLQPQQPKHFTHSFLTAHPAHACPVNN